MAKTTTTMATLAMAMLMGVAMQSGLAAAQAAGGCTSVIMTLAPCMNYLGGQSPTPSSECCAQLAGVVKSQPGCLCLVVNGGMASFGVNVNKDRALAMPDACKVQTPPISQCSGEDASANSTSPGEAASAGAPSTVPASSLTPPDPASSAAVTPASSGSGASNSSAPSSSSGASLTISFLFLAGYYSFSAF
ncbi:non-specific lipid-transfer protein-like protein [Canna indica]|uniref:Non-specific lipid-transfer protein-like protein n=1 Tax=Canna indica TaxID=4628 RepID=A0AAQ3QQ97_9LILI|nr:non-specific lipid-transfer protein-like protein [Canna indica]